MKLYRRGRIWWITFYHQGKRVQESTGTANERQAEKRYALRLAEIERGEYAKPVKTRLSEFAEQYLAYARANKRSWLRDQQMMNHLNKSFGPMLLTEITALPVERYKLERAKKVSPATVNRELALLKRLFNLADQWGFFRGRNPIKGIKFLAEDNLKLRILSEPEEQALLACCSPYLQDLVTFAIHTGLRLGEILNLTWEEVDLEDRMIRTLVRKNRRMLEVPLNDKALAVVEGWCGIRKNSYVFYNPETGGPWKDLWLGFQKACRKAGLEGVTWHTCRHTFASRLTRKGADLVTVKELLGHSSVAVTMRYAHTSREAKERAVALLTERQSGSPDKTKNIRKPTRRGDNLVTLPVRKTNREW